MAKVTEFNIFGLKIPVKRRVGMIELGSRYGHYDPELKEIHVDVKLKDKALLMCLMHEAVHAMHDRLNIEIDSVLEEMYCDLLPALIEENFNVSLKSTCELNV